MSIDRERLRRRRDEPRRIPPVPPRPGSPALVGQVFANPTVPTATSCYFSVHPRSIAGAEVEGGAATIATSAASLLVYVPGGRVPVAGDDLICRLVGNRWVADRLGAGTCVATLTITVVDPCGGSVLVLDALTATQGGTTIRHDPPGFQATTSITGVYSLIVPAAGPWTVTATTPGGSSSITMTAVCGSAVTGTLTLTATTTLTGNLYWNCSDGGTLVGDFSGVTAYAFTGGGFAGTTTSAAGGPWSLDVTAGCAGPFTAQFSRSRWATANFPGTITATYGYAHAVVGVTGGLHGGRSADGSPASGYQCTPLCRDPIAAALTLDVGGGVTVTLTFSFSAAVDGGGTFYPGWVGCRHSGATNTYYYFDGTQLQVQTATGASCPGSPVFDLSHTIAYAAADTAGSRACPPSAASFTFAASGGLGPFTLHE